MSFAFLHPGCAVLVPTAERMLWCASKSGVEQWTGSWQCRAGWILFPGNQVSSDCPCNALPCPTPLMCQSVPSSMSSWSLGLFLGWFFTPTLPLLTYAIYCCGGGQLGYGTKTSQCAGPRVAMHPISYYHHLRRSQSFRTWGQSLLGSSREGEAGLWGFFVCLVFFFPLVEDACQGHQHQWHQCPVSLVKYLTESRWYPALLRRQGLI